MTRILHKDLYNTFGEQSSQSVAEQLWSFFPVSDSAHRADFCRRRTLTSAVTKALSFKDRWSCRLNARHSFLDVLFCLFDGDHHSDAEDAQERVRVSAWIEHNRSRQPFIKTHNEKGMCNSDDGTTISGGQRSAGNTLNARTECENLIYETTSVGYNKQINSSEIMLLSS